MPAFDPEQFFRLAQELQRMANDEASQRSAISRAYYSCHLAARDRLYGMDKVGLSNAEKKRLAGEKVGDHRAIELAVAQNKNLQRGAAKKMSDKLSELQELREVADYMRNNDGPLIENYFRRYNVKDWDGMARVALALTSNLLPEVNLLRP